MAAAKRETAAAAKRETAAAAERAAATKKDAKRMHGFSYGSEVLRKSKYV